MAALEEAYGVDGNPRAWPPGVKQRLTRRYERLERQEQRRALDLLLDDLASYLRDLLAIQAGAGADHLVNVDHESSLRRDALRLPAPAAVAGLRAIARCREALDRNGSPELQLERLLLAIALPLYAAA
jgi:DNA polymerase III subunit delta'